MTQPVSKVVRRARRPHVKIRQARQAQQQEPHRLTGQILVAGAAAAAAITQSGLTPAELEAWRTDCETRLQAILQHPEPNPGPIEEALAAAAKEPLRLLAQRAAQAQANATPCQCSPCHGELTDRKFLARGIDSRFGRLTVWRGYGWGPHCQAWGFPADHALGLAKQASASPCLQEIAALLVTRMPAEQAVPVAARLGLDLSRCWFHQEAHRQGLKAQTRRAATVAQGDDGESLQTLAGQTAKLLTEPFTLVIEIEAWNIRERADGGQPKALRQQGQKIERWHWVYLATVFRLDHRGQTAGGRAIISQRGYVATRQGLEALTAQLYREALQRGLGQAQEVSVIADGAVWIWNLVKDRLPKARQRLDRWPVEEHLRSVAHDLHGRGTPAARAWVEPLRQQVRHDQTPTLIASLKNSSRAWRPPSSRNSKPKSDTSTTTLTA
jgi:hypothetical protein